MDLCWMRRGLLARAFTIFIVLILTLVTEGVFGRRGRPPGHSGRKDDDGRRGPGGRGCP